MVGEQQYPTVLVSLAFSIGSPVVAYCSNPRPGSCVVTCSFCWFRSGFHSFQFHSGWPDNKHMLGCLSFFFLFYFLFFTHAIRKESIWECITRRGICFQNQIALSELKRWPWKPKFDNIKWSYKYNPCRKAESGKRGRKLLLGRPGNTAAKKIVNWDTFPRKRLTGVEPRSSSCCKSLFKPRREEAK